ncbi:Na+-transporting NADH:ubiquinone oxidoreductase subunit A [Fluviicoccus keumensis]|uniref:Na(+)-translocating NADH-quinone reductase subunit A n=1 Tax=Fluviicoccus keumensis TaxID=1435465 RepID=A0A4Q7Z983_9GAMM|nr:Na(+)-translocating NADH-quinone reductase subunit A [Fluviicoccus keumensis]RZU47082.1 Na+-transporting NADH:ubiquinone oxidoreductase subunit A [Fluviicoccus keumensis]
MVKIKRGLDIPISGAPSEQVSVVSSIRSVALIGADYHGMMPSMKVAEGDRVIQGQPLFTDKKNPRVQFTAPVTGQVRAINRGERRVFQSLVIDVEPGAQDIMEFRSYNRAQIQNMDRESAITQLLASGLWTAIRTRPYNKVADPDTTPSAVFVNAMDTNPLAADPAPIIRAQQQAFDDGLSLVSRLAPKIYVCKDARADFPCGAFNPHEFYGPHPAGLVGTHIHFLDPVSAHKTVWHLDYQDVIAIGKLFSTGFPDHTRIVSLAGPAVKRPHLVKIHQGSSLMDLTTGELTGSNNRIISGSVLSGRTAQGVEAWLGRYHLQVSVLPEGVEREFIHYLKPGVSRFSQLGIYLGKWLKQSFPMSTSTNGSPRAMVPVGVYEEIMPLDILPTQLLRYLLVGDSDMAQALGCLELDEEDLGLCTFVCPGKYEYGPILRDMLERIEKEG